MRIVFMGTPDFAVPALEDLLACGHEVVGVFTQPDKPVGRKQVLTPPPVKVLAERFGLPVYQPERLKNSNAAAVIRSLQPEVIVVVAYGKILPKEILEAAPFGCINVHASLLPKYRGAAPIQWAVLNGETETGVCIMQMDEGLDTGDVLICEKTEIGINETSEALFDRLAALGGSALLRALDQIEKGTAVATPQPQGDFGYAKMITKAMSPIDWNRSAQEIHNQVRGLQSWPVALTTLNGVKLKIHTTRLTELTGGQPGEVIASDQQLVVSCGDGRCLAITELQLESKKRLPAEVFLRGNPVPVGTVLGGTL
ncbi:MAG: methionyl-tRNA formyltransferase [Eubacterium sp.]|nr:methionyl-tRNA formyltransferase [Eubacterium sp.]